MKNRRLVATVASACTLGLIVGLGTVAFVGSAGAMNTGNRKYVVTLTGPQEVPPNVGGVGTGTVKVKAKQSTVCVVFKKISGIGAAIAAHIHEAAVGVDGPIVVPLATPVQAGKFQKSKTCAVVSATLLAGLQNNPAGFYLNVHTGALPGGAIRGQVG